MDAPPLCLSEDIADRNDKSEPVPYLEDSVRIIMRCLVLTKKMKPSNSHLKLNRISAKLL